VRTSFGSRLQAVRPQFGQVWTLPIEAAAATVGRVTPSAAAPDAGLGALTAAVRAALAGAGVPSLTAGVQRLMAAYRSGEVPAGPVMATRADAAAYAAYRMPATVAATAAALGEMELSLAGWRPRSVLDFGAGTGGASWAAVSRLDSVDTITLLEQSPEAIRLGRAIFAESESPALRSATWRSWQLGGSRGRSAADMRAAAASGPAAVRQASDGPCAHGPAADLPGADGTAADVPGANGPAGDGLAADGPASDGPGAGSPAGDGPAGDGPAGDGPAADVRAADGLAADGPAANGPAADLPVVDLAVAAYVLGELAAAQQAALVGLAVAAAPAVLVVEPGTPAGHRRILAARERLLSAGYQLAAPCPHQLRCPLDTPGDWCHFAARLPRSAVHRQVKGAELNYEDEKFSYVAAVRPDSAVTPRRPAGRVVRRPQQRKGLVLLDLCASDGRTRRELVSKSKGEAYRRARKTSWGDPWG